MAFYPNGDLWPVSVRILAAQLERRALQEGLAERAPARAGTPPQGRSAPRQYLPIAKTPRPSQRVVRRRAAQKHHERRIPLYRMLALLVALVAAALFGLVGVYILRGDLPVFVTAVTLLIFGWALALTEVWALPSLYRWVYWRWLLVWR